MLLLVIWIAVAVAALVVLGSIVFGLAGAVKRLGREVSALDRDLRPVLAQVQDAAARAADAGRSADREHPPA